METDPKPGAKTVPKNSGAKPLPPPIKKSDPALDHKTLTAKELLKVWLADPDIDHVILIGLPKSGLWKFAFSNGNFEFLMAGAAILMKCALDRMSSFNLNIKEPKK